MNQRIEFIVYGDAKPAGSKRAFFRTGMKHPSVVDANPNSKPWKHQIAAVAREHYTGELLTGALRVTFRFVRVRPGNHYKGNGELSKAGRESLGPTTRPDALKLARAAEDALTKVIWNDDAQIIEERLLKEWGSPARVEVTIENLRSPT